MGEGKPARISDGVVRLARFVRLVHCAGITQPVSLCHRCRIGSRIGRVGAFCPTKIKGAGGVQTPPYILLAGSIWLRISCAVYLVHGAVNTHPVGIAYKLLPLEGGGWVGVIALGIPHWLRNSRCVYLVHSAINTRPDRITENALIPLFGGRTNWPGNSCAVYLAHLDRLAHLVRLAYWIPLARLVRSTRLVRSIGLALPLALSQLLLLVLSMLIVIGSSWSLCLAANEMMQFRGHLRADFSQYAYAGGGKSRWQAGLRCDLKSTRFLIEGLGMETDFRYRHYNSQWKSSLKSLYELAVFYRPPGGQEGQGWKRGQGIQEGQEGEKRQEGQAGRSGQGIYFKIGRFNLFDLSGVGQLDGSAVGWSFSKNLLTGLYLGGEPNLAEVKTDNDYRKEGLFLSYRALGGINAIFSCNQVRFQGFTERTFLYGQAFLPIRQRVYSYQQVEYEIGPQAQTHLTRIFLNTRFDLNRSISTTSSYYYGQGHDYHRMLLEKIKSGQTPTTEDLEQFYWYQDLGFRLSLKVGQRQRISGHASLARKERDGDVLPRYGVSYFIDDLLGDLPGDLPAELLGELLSSWPGASRVGGGVRFTRTIETQTIRNMLSLDMDADLSDRLTLGLSYTNYTFQFVEEESTIISPSDSSEYNLNFSVRINRQFQVYGFIQYITEKDYPGSAACWQNYLSLVYRL